ncbi:tRNA (N6-threonylcarbamoyladenosine(37)-N6)-methyltransferase TrmO [Thermodesulfovibrionales bacterium]|nr:tRNA (N6-threonylcarbamoyladenosine(37)-N6)-methyltransferase TrmO [Thermodesulfovibrionales bacterium]
MEYKLKPIEIIHTSYKTKEDCPIQGSLQPEGEGIIEVFPEYAEGLKDIETFSHIILLYIFDKAGDVKLVRPTFLDDSSHGVFASRHPCRPNGLGLSIVKLLKRNKNILKVGGIDILDSTPLIDIKPYIPRFDYFSDANNGWVESKELRQKPPDRE